MKNVLIVGNGGREHALAWKLRQSPQVDTIYVAPGNAGTEAIAQNIPIKVIDIEELLRFVEDNHIDLVVVGPELPLSLGLVDRLGAAGIRAFGPTQAAARLETSKVFAKDFMIRHGIPTAPYRVASTCDEARRCVSELGLPVAIKADGLTAGKGVTVCQTMEQAESALHKALVVGVFGEAGRPVVIEAGLSGEELSVLAFCDQYTAVPMVAAQDHKAIFDYGRGPNTGGMGSYAPAPFLDAAGLSQVTATILQPAIDGMRNEGTPFRGVLYAGLMLTETGPQVLEFNVRFGDPETQVILPLLEADLLDALDACVDDRLSDLSIRWSSDSCVCVICASPGYPDEYPTGLPVIGLPEAEARGANIFHAGTRYENGRLVTSGGRVLGVTYRAPELEAAIAGAYWSAHAVCFEGMQYRCDIGAKALRKKGC